MKRAWEWPPPPDAPGRWKYDNIPSNLHLSGPTDIPGNYIVPNPGHEKVSIEVCPGNGGGEVEDWAEMLFEMYQRFLGYRNAMIESIGTKKDWNGKTVSKTIVAVGRDLKQELSNEASIHRLVRKSPFDPEYRRHTSFVAVFIDGEAAQEGDGSPELVRSYVFDPYRRVKDHKTGKKTDDIDAVLRGDIFLLWGENSGVESKGVGVLRRWWGWFRGAFNQ